MWIIILGSFLQPDHSLTVILQISYGYIDEQMRVSSFFFFFNYRIPASRDRS